MALTSSSRLCRTTSLALASSSHCVTQPHRCLHAASSSAASASATSTSSSSSSRRPRKSRVSEPPTPLSTRTPLSSSSPPTFASLNLASTLCHRLQQSGLQRPTPIQAAVIPHLLRRPWNAASYPDCIVQEMTGQGKTLSYLLPILNTIDRTLPHLQAIVVVPTRELATQVTRVVRELSSGIGSAAPLSVTTLVGHSNPAMLSSLARSSVASTPQLLADEQQDATSISSHHPHLIIGTPQVLHEIFVQRKLTDVHSILPLTHLKYLVFDEVDALLNASASRNTIVPLIQLRHHATALALTQVQADQARLDADREERKARKTMKKHAGGGEVEEVEIYCDDEGVPILDENGQPQIIRREKNDSSASESSSSASSSSPSSDLISSPQTSSFPRNQVVFVSATVTTAVHQFAARYLSSSRAFLTSLSVADEYRRKQLKKEKDGTVARPTMDESEDGSSATATSATASNALISSPPIQRIPPHIRHYYLLVNRPYDRQNSLQQLLQAIKFQFDAWKTSALRETHANGKGIGKAEHIPASLIKKALGPERALSAGGVAKHNAVSPLSFLRGGVSSLGLGATGHFKQSSLVFVDDTETLGNLVNPLSQQGFNLGVVSEVSGRHERREALRLERTELLVATDILARGMDLKSLTHVVNYAPPATPNLYLHRAGRVGRLGAVHSKIGSVVTLVDAQADKYALQHLSKVAGTLGITFSRVYVKKGKIYEDSKQESIVSAENVPIVEEFIAEKEERPIIDEDQAKSNKLKSKRLMGEKTHNKQYRPTARSATDIPHSFERKFQSPRSSTASSTEPKSDSPSYSLSSSISSPSSSSSSRPLDPVGSHIASLAPHNLKLHDLAALELTTPKTKRKHRNADRQL